MEKKVVVCISAISGGLLFNYLNVPAGAMIGSLLGTAVSQMAMDFKLSVSPRFKHLTRMIMGSYVGLSITIEGVRQIRSIAGAVIITILGLVFIAAMATYILHKLFKFDLTEAYLSCLPAGLSEISMNAEDYKVDPLRLTTIHLIRLISTIVLIPILISYLK